MNFLRIFWGFCFVFASAYLASNTNLYGDMSRAAGQSAGLFFFWFSVDSRLQAGHPTKISRAAWWVWAALCAGLVIVLILAPGGGASKLFQIVFLTAQIFIPIWLGKLIDKFQTTTQQTEGIAS